MKPRTIASFLLALFCLTLTAPLLSAAPTETVLHRFSLRDGASPGSLISDSSGNLYGSAYSGVNGGVVFKLSLGKNGRWKDTTLYAFCPLQTACPDGQLPMGRLLLDAAGNLYGTTQAGGAHNIGTVFKLTPTPTGQWNETVLHSFGVSIADGKYPEAGLISDAKGNLYGTTVETGSDSQGLVFELTPHANGKWTEKILHTFRYTGDGFDPQGELLFDRSGNLYGTTLHGGSHAGSCGVGCGTIYELSPQPNGSWKETLLHAFQLDGVDGDAPYAGLTWSGNTLYGTTANGGKPCTDETYYGCGTVYSLTPQADGTWKEAVIYNFSGPDGELPLGSVVGDQAGNLFGTTSNGAISHNGTVFKLSPESGGQWTFATLQEFQGRDGSGPVGSLVLDLSDNLFGTTQGGGGNGWGCVFEITP